MNGQDMVGDDVAAAATEIVEREMGPFGLRAVTVTAAEDHDGDPILLVEVEYRAGGKPIEPKVVAGLATKLRRRLWEMGEMRFPHVRHHFSARQKVARYP
ncbi:MAG TPA: hypothetical protein VGB88_05035 [Alphaproteobacteria bacterium]